MTIVNVGVSHRIAPAELLEKLAVPSAELGGALAHLHAVPDIDEVVVLSTCNRVEVYTAGSRPAKQVTRAVADLMAARGRVRADEVLRLVPGGRGRGDRHPPVNAHGLAVTRCGNRLRDGGEGDMPPARAVHRDPVGLRARRHRAGPAEPHPPRLRHPDLAGLTGHPADTLASTADISGEVTRRFLPA